MPEIGAHSPFKIAHAVDPLWAGHSSAAQLLDPKGGKGKGLLGLGDRQCGGSGGRRAG